MNITPVENTPLPDIHQVENTPLPDIHQVENTPLPDIHQVEIPSGHKHTSEQNLHKSCWYGRK